METSDAVRHTPSWIDTLPYGLPTVRTLVQRTVARTVSPQLSRLWLLLRHPPILSLSLSLAYIRRPSRSSRSSRDDRG